MKVGVHFYLLLTSDHHLFLAATDFVKMVLSG